MNKKLLAVIEGALVVALGVLIAVFGGQDVMDIYFGVVFIIAGAGLLTFAIVGLVKTKILSFAITFFAFAALLLGTFLVARYYSFGYLVYTLILLIIAAGGALIFKGVYTIVKYSVIYGIGQIVVGAAAIVLGILYLTVPEFYAVFWIIVGILVAIYGLVMIIGALVSKENKSKEKSAE